MAKPHEGELIEMMKTKSGCTYQQIAAGIGKSERALMKWKLQEVLTKDVKESLSQFLQFDVRAFDTTKVRDEVLKSYKSPFVKSVVGESEMPKLLTRMDEKMGRMQENLDALQKQMERLVRELNRRN